MEKTFTKFVQKFFIPYPKIMCCKKWSSNSRQSLEKLIYVFLIHQKKNCNYQVHQKWRMKILIGLKTIEFFLKKSQMNLSVKFQNNCQKQKNLNKTQINYYLASKILKLQFRVQKIMTLDNSTMRTSVRLGNTFMRIFMKSKNGRRSAL